MQKLKYALQRFMIGRNGTDLLGWISMLAALALSLVAAVTDKSVFNLLALAGLAYAIFRMYSRNVSKRQAENQAFLRFFRNLKTRLTDREHRYFSCPQCHQTVRVPKGKGTIAIRCPKCQNRFTKKT